MSLVLYTLSNLIHLGLFLDWLYLSLTIPWLTFSIFDHFFTDFIHLWQFLDWPNPSLTIPWQTLSIFDYSFGRALLCQRLSLSALSIIWYLDSTNWSVSVSHFPLLPLHFYLPSMFIGRFHYFFSPSPHHTQTAHTNTALLERVAFKRFIQTRFFFLAKFSNDSSSFVYLPFSLSWTLSKKNYEKKGNWFKVLHCTVLYWFKVLYFLSFGRELEKRVIRESGQVIRKKKKARILKHAAFLSLSASS